MINYKIASLEARLARLENKLASGFWEREPGHELDAYRHQGKTVEDFVSEVEEAFSRKRHKVEFHWDKRNESYKATLRSRDLPEEDIYIYGDHIHPEKGFKVLTYDRKRNSDLQMYFHDGKELVSRIILGF